jgi:hypothetical protein
MKNCKNSEKKTLSSYAESRSLKTRCGEKDEVARLQREVAHRDEMLSALKEELGFMRMAFQTLEREIAAPLAMLAEPVKKKHWWQRV